MSILFGRSQVRNLGCECCHRTSGVTLVRRSCSADTLSGTEEAEVRALGHRHAYALRMEEKVNRRCRENPWRALRKISETICSVVVLHI